MVRTSETSSEREIRAVRSWTDASSQISQQTRAPSFVGHRVTAEGTGLGAVIATGSRRTA
jgi:hypothetical protein